MQVLALLLALTGCNSAPPEPSPDTAAPRPVTPAPTLIWNAPAAWQVEKAAESGTYRAKYTIPTQGDAKHPAELLVQRFSGPKEAAEERGFLLELFEKTEGPKMETIPAGSISIEWTEIEGSYRFPMGPPMGKKRRHSAHVIKEDWRALVAIVNTGSRGHWVFRMVGPDDTVASARGALRSMVEGVTLSE